MGTNHLCAHNCKLTTSTFTMNNEPTFDDFEFETVDTDNLSVFGKSNEDEIEDEPDVIITEVESDENDEKEIFDNLAVDLPTSSIDQPVVANLLEQGKHCIQDPQVSVAKGKNCETVEPKKELEVEDQSTFKLNSETISKPQINGKKFETVEPKKEIDVEVKSTLNTKTISRPKVKAEHDPESGGYICDICSKTYKSPRVVRLHQQQMHSGQERVQCPQCYKTFTRASCLKRHLLIHEGESGKNIHCDACGKSFFRGSDLKKHVLVAHSERLKCSQCDKTFYDSKHLKGHQVIAHGAENSEDVIIYQCDQCEKAFLRSYELVRHKLNHTDERNCTCPTCGKAFHLQWHLDGHMRVHSEEKPFKCDICPKAFKTQSTLNRHKMLNRHKFPSLKKEKFVCHACDFTCRKEKQFEEHVQTHNMEAWALGQ